AVLQGAGQLLLLSHPAVLDDLNPTAEERAHIAEFTRRLNEQRHEAFRDFHRLKPEEREQRFVDLARANEAAMTATLKRVHVNRLKQIALQLQGLAAFREAGVATTLKLTAEQKNRLRALEAETSGFLPGPPRVSFGPPPGPPPHGGPGPRKDP